MRASTTRPSADSGTAARRAETPSPAPIRAWPGYSRERVPEPSCRRIAPLSMIYARTRQGRPTRSTTRRWSACGTPRPRVAEKRRFVTRFAPPTASNVRPALREPVMQWWPPLRPRSVRRWGGMARAEAAAFARRPYPRTCKAAAPIRTPVLRSRPWVRVLTPWLHGRSGLEPPRVRQAHPPPR